MTLRLRHLLVLIAVLAAVGCGSDDEPEGEKLPAVTVSQLQQRLDEIGRRFNDARDNDNPGACSDIESDSFPAIEDLIAGLPDDVDPDIRSATEDSFQRLRELTAEECSNVEPPQAETVPAPETETERVPPETVPPKTETTAPDTNTTPSDQDEEDENGNGNGLGNGGTPPGQGGSGGGLGAPGGGE